MADPADCSFQFNPVGTSKFTSACDIAKTALVRAGVPYVNVVGPAVIVTVAVALSADPPTLVARAQ